ncbi:LSU ribosomal protein L13P [Geoalkalibacter ferrihydriticus]|uniref:Large ribosomal subunit protein uL13 n=2 Tax=Geoalkalibacter ferrihydriticus TaxID=392333 RepID=A0A0C2DT34_9BACT|nr:50S ribosomal protein L13 [Geoalkalibacter ferrihydriticus]KIH76609.1 50S ribosomal protein L13 [Geoalkalibacter ferrihydriticus DSM 17813]SDM03429.1 LSU ribosomal protein L13P [Geoalkalibacter ferrihydriticus]
MSTRVVSNSQVEKSWYVIDVEGKVLGRAATEVARILRGKHKAIYAPSVDTGDFVIILNADKIRLTGNKMADKMYYRHSGYPGGIKSINAEKLLATKPEELIKKAVKGMLPKNKLGRQMFKKLKVYTGVDHPHQAQQPKELTF